MNEFTPSEQRQIALDKRLRAEFAAYTEVVGALADVSALMKLSGTALELALAITADERECDCRLTMEPRRWPPSGRDDDADYSVAS